MAASPDLDRLQRRVMFAMDFRDPITRLPVRTAWLAIPSGINAASVREVGRTSPFTAPAGR